MEHQVIIAGAGPVGLSLAVGLAHHGARPVVLEEDDGLTEHSRAAGLLPRTLEILRSWDLLDRFREEGNFLSEIPIWIAGRNRPITRLDLRVLEDISTVPGLLILPQNRTESLLAESLRETGVEIRFGHRLQGFRERDDRILADVEPRQGARYELEGEYLVGCDGAHSRVRESLGWELEGKTYPSRVLLADVILPDARSDLPFPRIAPVERGILAGLKITPRLWRIIASLPKDESEEDALSPESIARRVAQLFGAGPFETVWTSVSSLHRRTSPHFRRGRALLAGDAAHLVSPAGGQGMNSGIQDAHNLAWKLARALRGGDAELLLASYEQERRSAVLTKIERYTDLLTRVAFFPAPAVRNTIGWLAARLARRRFLFKTIAPRAGMLDTHYRFSLLISGSGRALGARAPDGLVLRPDGSRTPLHDLVRRDAALLLFDGKRLPRWNVREVRELIPDVPGLVVFRMLPPEREPFASATDLRIERPAYWRSWNAAEGLAVLLRPDGHIGWMEHRPTPASLRKGVRRAVGLRSVRGAAALPGHPA